MSPVSNEVSSPSSSLSLLVPWVERREVYDLPGSSLSLVILTHMKTASIRYYLVIACEYSETALRMEKKSGCV
jgi:hypothetical protein